MTGIFEKFWFEKEPSKLYDGYVFESNSTTYKLIGRLGSGGMSQVWRAQRTSLAGVENVALKIFNKAGKASVFMEEEAMKIAHLHHDNIVQFIDSGTDGTGNFFIAIAFVEGYSLNEFQKLAFRGCHLHENLQSTGYRIPDKIIAHIVYSVLCALNYAHNHDLGKGKTGLIHRDVSPENILLEKNKGFVKLSDFGIAALRDNKHNSCKIAGKVPYMAPEILTEKDLTPSADIYSLGLVAYELLTDFNPNTLSVKDNTCDSILGVISEIMLSLDKTLLSPSKIVEGIDEKLCSIVLKMLEKDPAKRYINARQVMDDLEKDLLDQDSALRSQALSEYISIIEKSKYLKLSECKVRHTVSESDLIYNSLPVYKLTSYALKDIEAGNNPCRE